MILQPFAKSLQHHSNYYNTKFNLIRNVTRNPQVNPRICHGIQSLIKGVPFYHIIEGGFSMISSCRRVSFPGCFTVVKGLLHHIQL